MCSTAMSRRGFAASSLVGLSALPFVAHAAANIEALAIMCIDYRLVDSAVSFFDDKRNLRKQFDLVALAGASLAAVAPAFPASNAAFWDHVSIAQQLHNIKRVVMLDHRDCGAYKVQFGSHYADGGTAELEQHRGIMKLTAAEFERRKINLPLEFYLMAVDGTTERVTV
ncbi:MAG TPA: carbonic anhydrase [Rhizomicrobium sp.]|nr:carbonic anhydrase [Rhizomicrobium sp.]